MSPTLVILLVAATVATSCALIGSFLVLRKLTLLGDAISHAVLPGIAVAFLISGSRSPLPMVIGAAALGVLTVFLVELGTRSKRLQEDASIGVVFPALFSIGVILISRYAGAVDLDLDCVLYGEIAYAPWDLMTWNGISLGPRALLINAVILLLNLVFILLFYKELKITTFDAGLAAALGFSPVLMHYLLMTMLSITVVGAFDSVGAILVVAMLVVPPATAYLLTDRLSRLIGLACLFGLASAGLGYALARVADSSIAGAMASVAGLLFAIVFLLSPRHGLLAQLLRQRRLSQGMAEQLLLLHLGENHDSRAPAAVAQRFAWSLEKMEKVASRLIARGWARRTSAAELELTAEGAAAVERSGQALLRH